VGRPSIIRPARGRDREARLPIPHHVAPAGLQPASREDIRTALAVAADLGMFFRLADPAADPAGWQPVRLLYGSQLSRDQLSRDQLSRDQLSRDQLSRGRLDGGQDHLDALLGSVRAALGGCEPRVAASLFFQGYASRLLSPPLACLAASGCVPAMTADRLRWRHPEDQMIELGLTADEGWAGSDRRLIEQLVAASFEEHLEPLADALRRRVRIAAGLLTGNAASALVSGLALLQGRLGPDWRSLAAHAVAQPRLRGSGTWRANPEHGNPEHGNPEHGNPEHGNPRRGGDGEPVFVRRSCCLYYRVAGDGLCADCPMAARGVPGRPEIRS
jgi:ferric iron reductase protein FhuF